MFALSPILHEHNVVAPADSTPAAAAASALPDSSPRPPSPEPVDIADLTAAAYQNAPQCGGVPCRWVTIKQASRALGISTSVISNFASRGYIAVVKGDSASSHRYVHLENVLWYLKTRMQASAARAKEKSGGTLFESEEAAAH